MRLEAGGDISAREVGIEEDIFVEASSSSWWSAVIYEKRGRDFRCLLSLARKKLS